MKQSICMVVAVVVLLMQGCAGYNASRLPSTDVTTYDAYQNQDGLKVAAKFLDAKESKDVFGVEDVHKNYQPVYILVDNRTTNTYGFKKRMMSKQTAPAEEVAEKCSFNTAGRATTYGVAGIFIWPLLIPAVVDGVGSSNANKSMKNDYMYKEIKDERVSPNGLLNGVVFLDRMKDGETLDIRLTNVDNDEIKLFSFEK
ncbi:MAG: hypothetical protein P9M13_01290 [Candidatus Ancaeobacter aquaticus]|nr:hypothetical protein [Candidatus Ancaeobacter aquaticus]